MLKNIRDLVKIGKLIDKIEDKVSNNTESIDKMTGTVNELKKDLESFSSEIKKLKEHQTSVLDDFEKEMVKIKKLVIDFKSSIYEVSVFRKDAFLQLLKRFDEDIKKEIQDSTKDLKASSLHYSALKEELSNISKRTRDVSAEIDKFVKISHKIKQGDFELNKFATQLKTMDKEKLNLLRKIDNLERLVGRMRRR